MESPVPRKGLRKNGPAATAAAFLLLGAFHSAAFAATGTISQCATDAHDLTSMEVSRNTLDELAIDRVDHEAAESEVASLAAMEADAESTSTPLLYLTPRVANMLRDIFRIQQDSIPGTDALNKPSSPVAGSVDDVDITVSGEEVAPLTGTEKEILPSFHQQMFRKDI